MKGIRVRIRPRKDDDIAAWYEEQENKSTAVRRAIRYYMSRRKEEQSELVQAIARAVMGKMVRAIPGALNDAVRGAVSAELDHLPDAVTAAVEEALSRYGTGAKAHAESEDDEMAARIDEQLAGFFNH